MNEFGSLVLLTALNIGSSKGISIANKFSLRDLGVPFAPYLTVLHLVTTSIYSAKGLNGLIRNLRDEGSKRIDSKLVFQVTLIGALNALSIVLMISSLGQNSLGFSQLAKLASIPCTLLIQYLWYGDRFSGIVIASLATMLCGIALASWSDPSFNVQGTYTAAAAVPVTSAVQVMSSKVQNGRGSRLNSDQYMFMVFSTSAVTVLISMLLFDLGYNHTGSWADHIGETWRESQATVQWVLLSCALAIGVNWSTSKLLKVSSAMTYMAIGQAKTCLTFLIDYVVFQQPYGVTNVIGILLAVAGLVGYSIVKHREKRVSSSDNASDKQREKTE